MVELLTQSGRTWMADVTSSETLVSVVICTRNRSADLANALRSAIEQVPATPPYEVVVVDNGSTDDTPHVVAGFEGRCTLRYVHEPTPGLCHARNTGWRTARGVYVAYLDDDAVASSTWVAAVVDAFAQGADIGVVGGRVDPVWLAPRPSWLADRLALGLTIVNWSSGPKILTDLGSEWVVGANMAIRADVLLQVGGFRPELDRVGARMLSSGDVFLVKEVLRLGLRCLYWPRMTVAHLVPASRLTKRWFRERNYWQGVSDAVMRLLDEQPTTGERLRLAVSATARLVKQPRRLAALMLPTDDPERMAQQCWTLIELGHVAGLWGRARVEAPRPSARSS